MIVSEVTRVAPPKKAPSATPVVTGTACVQTTNEVLVDPAGTTTVGGTIAVSGALLARFTVTPPAPAGAVRVTVACDELPLATVDGESERLLSAGWDWRGALGITVTVAIGDELSTAPTRA
jgi:hypothetical protein